MTHEDRRRCPRVRVAGIASLRTCGTLNSNDQAVCAVVDLSRSGIGLETGQPPSPGQGVILRLALGETIHELKTVVTRIERRGSSHFYRVGLDWSRCSRVELAFLDELLATTPHPSAG